MPGRIPKPGLAAVTQQTCHRGQVCHLPWCPSWLLGAVPHIPWVGLGVNGEILLFLGLIPQLGAGNRAVQGTELRAGLGGPKSICGTSHGPGITARAAGNAQGGQNHS